MLLIRAAALRFRKLRCRALGSCVSRTARRGTPLHPVAGCIRNARLSVKPRASLLCFSEAVAADYRSYLTLRHFHDRVRARSVGSSRCVAPHVVSPAAWQERCCLSCDWPPYLTASTPGRAEHIHPYRFAQPISRQAFALGILKNLTRVCRVNEALGKHVLCLELRSLGLIRPYPIYERIVWLLSTQRKGCCWIATCWPASRKAIVTWRTCRRR